MCLTGTNSATSPVSQLLLVTVRQDIPVEQSGRRSMGVILLKIKLWWAQDPATILKAHSITTQLLIVPEGCAIG